MNVHMRVTCAISILFILQCCTLINGKVFPIKKILKKTDPMFAGRLPTDPNLTQTRIEAGLLQLALIKEGQQNATRLNKTLTPARCGFPFYTPNAAEF